MTKNSRHICTVVLLLAVKLILVLGCAAIWMVGVSFYPGLPNVLPSQLLIMAGLYVVVLYCVATIYKCFSLGLARVRDLSVGFAIALFFAVAFSYLEFFLVTRRAADVVPFILVFVIQVLVSLLFLLVANQIYFKINPEDRVLAILSGTEYEKKTLSNLVSIPERFTVNGVINQRYVDDASLPKLMESCSAVFLGEVSEYVKDLVFNYCYSNSMTVYVLPSASMLISQGYNKAQISDSLLFTQSNIGLSVDQRFVKRIIDIVGALIGLVISFIPMILAAVIIKLTDGGPIFYRQARYTKDKRVFNVFKLRSMRVDAEADGARLTVPHDKRITPIGRFLRRTRLDEVPQFINVLKGDMSLVGPRAERLETSDVYIKAAPEFAYRLKVKAGITGYAQINGRYNTSFENKLRMDLFYITNYSVFNDVVLMLETLRVLFLPESTQGFTIGSVDEFVKSFEEAVDSAKSED